MPTTSTTLPSLTITDAGTHGTATVYGGPFLGPQAISEAGGQTFIVLDRDFPIVDATCVLQTGGATTVEHYLLVCVGNIQNVIGYLQASLLQAGSAQRHAPKLKLPGGVQLMFKSAHPSSATTEAITWTLYAA